VAGRGIPRRTVRRPHVDSLLKKLWVTHVGRAFARTRGESEAKWNAEIVGLSEELRQHGLTPIELEIELAEMRRATDAFAKKMKRNRRRRR